MRSWDNEKHPRKSSDNSKSGLDGKISHPSLIRKIYHHRIFTIPLPFLRSLDEASSGRRFLLSDRGYMGLALESAEEGGLDLHTLRWTDSICIAPN